MIQYLQDGKKLPIDVLIGAMRQAWEEGEIELAAAYAKDAAPYFHPKLANIEMTGKDGGPVGFDQRHREYCPYSVCFR